MGEKKVDNQYCIIFNNKNGKDEIKLQTGTEKLAKQWIKVIHTQQESLRNAIIKGADIESDKLRVSDDVQWAKSKKSIPSEIAQFLSEEQKKDLGNFHSLPHCLEQYIIYPTFYRKTRNHD